MSKRLFRRLAVAAMFVTVSALAQTPPSIDVAFLIKPVTPPHPYDHFNRANTELLQKLVREGVARKLGGSPAAGIPSAFPLFTFKPVDAQPAEHHLSIVLEDDPQDVRAPKVILTLRMDAETRPDDDARTIVFRPETLRGAPTGPPDAFAAEIVRVIGNDIDTKRDFFTAIFKPIVITTKIFPLKSMKTFILTFAAEQYAIGDGSRFLVSTVDQTGRTCDFGAQVLLLRPTSPPPEPVPDEFRDGLRLGADHPPEGLQRLANGESLEPVGVHLLKHMRTSKPPGQRPPSGANLGEVHP